MVLDIQTTKSSLSLVQGSPIYLEKRYAEFVEFKSFLLLLKLSFTCDQKGYIRKYYMYLQLNIAMVNEEPAMETTFTCIVLNVYFVNVLFCTG